MLLAMCSASYSSNSKIAFGYFTKEKQNITFKGFIDTTAGIVVKTVLACLMPNRLVMTSGQMDAHIFW